MTNHQLKGKVFLITGATSGIGKATSFAIASRGATAVLIARNPDLGEATLREIKSKTGNANCDLLIADLSSQVSVRSLAQQFLSRYPNLHILINNAGIALKKRTLSGEGIEMTFAVNHLAYFLLTNLLLERLKQNAPAHIINVSSEAHRNVNLDFENLQGEKRYSGFGAYSITKICNVLFTYELGRRLSGTNVTVNAVHPGYLNTRIFRDTPGWFRVFVSLTAGRPQKGSEAIMHALDCAERDGVTARYFRGKKEARSSPSSYDEALAKRLWQLSEELTSLR
jgi:NAD(P)-dependent dehydrogenase (short-subunit alcohol dehydrogenase family)